MNERNPLLRIQAYGQSIWLDFLSRPLVTSGGLHRLIAEDGLRGLTSNPAIFSKSISDGEGYAGAIATLALDGLDAAGIYERLTVQDVQLAADAFGELHRASGGDHGFVSLEVNPHLADDTEATIDEARRLWRAVARPNALIKVPATIAGLEAIRRLIAEGINVNVTLLFGLDRYREVAGAYLAGLQERVAAGQPVDGIHSVASFFLSRIDVLVDPQLEALMAAGGDRAAAAARLHGQTAIASAKLAHAIYRELFQGDRFADLAAAGARPQRLLWASTSTKNPDYSDVKYVEALIGPDTVNTLPRETLEAYRDHGEPAPRLTEEEDTARQLLDLAGEAGVDLERVTDQLEREGVAKFNTPYDALLARLTGERAAALERRPPGAELALGEHQRRVEERLITLQENDFAARLWRKDPTLWTEEPERREAIAHALGWLDAPAGMAAAAAELATFASEVRAAGFRDVVHLGMGGSSLAPLVMRRTLGEDAAGLPLTVIDTTDPGTFHRLTESLQAGRTLFIVASKSGTTTEVRDLADLFLARVADAKDEDSAGENFVAITDPDTPLAELASERGFRRVFLNDPEVGGRYSALTYFGLVPAALMGLDVAELLARGQVMRHACRPRFPLRANPGVLLGAALGELAAAGRDKVTFLMPDALGALGLWLEQLLAESTGKQGKGLLPVAGEPAGPAAVYAADRVFVHYRLGRGADVHDDLVDELRRTGHPVITLNPADELDLGQEFLRWEIATATAGAILGIDPFDQPDVQAAKDATRDELERVRETGGLELPEPDLEHDGLQFFGAAGAEDPAAALDALLSAEESGGYLALLAYLPEVPAVAARLDAIRETVRERFRLATTAGYGPRYLHSTGQLHKGGPAGGHYLMFTAAAERPGIELPGRDYDLGTLQLAQAAGDLAALQDRGRRVLRIHLGEDLEAGLEKVARMLRHAGAASA